MDGVASYVVRYDSGFAPNPFYNFCTLATCKPEIRRIASVGEWIVGCGSNAKGIRLGGRLVYAMRVTEHLTFDQYDSDPRFEDKKPKRHGSRKQSCGDNIYYRSNDKAEWSQRDSFHSLPNGQMNRSHVGRDTGVNRVLISTQFVYFGGEGPIIPKDLRDGRGRSLCKSGIGWAHFKDPALYKAFESWLSGLGAVGYCGAPFEWLTLRSKQ